jgi:hypothetical protein
MRLKAASSSTREVYDDIRQRGKLPVVYYWLASSAHGRTWNGIPLLPSPYLYALVSGQQGTKSRYLRKYFPDSYHRAVLDGPQPSPHIMVVQEYFDRQSPFYSKVFGDHPAFDMIRNDAKSVCRRHDVVLGWTDFGILDDSSITVCTVR